MAILKSESLTLPVVHGKGKLLLISIGHRLVGPLLYHGRIDDTVDNSLAIAT